MRAVIDTNVMFVGLTDARSDAAVVLQGWAAGRFTPCISTWLHLECLAKLEEKLNPKRAVVACDHLRALVEMEHVERVAVIDFTVRPLLIDADDDGIVDCAVNGGATVIVTENTRNFVEARRLGMDVVSASRFLSMLEEE